MKNSTERIPMVLGSVGAFVAVAVAVWFALSSSGSEPLGMVKPDWTTYTSNTPLPFSIDVPENFIVNPKYTLQVTPLLKSEGVSFTVPPSFTEGTNLSTDTKFTVEWIPMLSSCRPEPYVDPLMGTSTLTQRGIVYNVASSSDAGAGNFYESTVYMSTEAGSCMAVRYFIHTTNIGNYPEGSVREYDRAKLLQTFDQMRFSLTRIVPAQLGASEPATN